MESGVVIEARAVSADLLREPLRESLCRFLEESSLSSKGFGRVVEQGSEETARSRDNSAGSRSIWQMQTEASTLNNGVGSCCSAAESLKASQLPEVLHEGIWCFPMRFRDCM